MEGKNLDERIRQDMMGLSSDSFIFVGIYMWFGECHVENVFSFYMEQ